MSRCTRTLALSCQILLVLGLARTASGQEEVDPAKTARFRVGPLRFTPSISLTSLGLDTNVFNESESPKDDKTATIGPAVDLWMNVGRTRITGHDSVEYLYFDEFKSQRGWNTQNTLRWEAPLGRLTPFIAGTYNNVKNRPGYEIDSRVRLTSQAAGLGVSLKLSSRTIVIVGAKRTRIAFSDTDSFLGSNLSQQLDEAANSEQLQLRYKLTSVTTFVVDGEGIQDRFVFTPLRDANSFRLLPGFEMKPSALISGKVFVGYRRFEPLSGTVPSYQGLAASVDAVFRARSTQITTKVGRDLTYSFQEVQPYYILTDANLAVLQRLTYTWDVTARAGRQILDYVHVRAAAPTIIDPFAVGALAPPTATREQFDTIHQYGGGFGYRVGRTLRLGLDVAYYRRKASDPEQRDYKGMRAGASISYGLPQ